MDEVTPEALYRRRREFIKSSVLFAATSVGIGGTLLPPPFSTLEAANY